MSHESESLPIIYSPCRLNLINQNRIVDGPPVTPHPAFEQQPTAEVVQQSIRLGRTMVSSFSRLLAPFSGLLGPK